MHLLPPNLAALADLTAKESSRYAMTGVHLRLHGDNTYRAMATDSKFAAIVAGPCDDADQFPAIPALAAAPNGATEGLIPAATWRAALKAAPKKAHYKPVLRNVAVVLGTVEATFASTDLEATNVVPTRLVEGRFPPLPDIMPVPAAAKATIAVDPARLATLLKTAAAFCPPADSAGGPRVTLELYPKKCLVAVRATNGGQRFDGLLMGLSDGKPVKANGTPAAEGEADDAGDETDAPSAAAEIARERDEALADVAHLKSRLDNLAAEKKSAEYDAAQKEYHLDRLLEVLSGREEQIADLAAENRALRDDFRRIAAAADADPALAATALEVVKAHLAAATAEHAREVERLREVVADRERTVEILTAERAADRQHLQRAAKAACDAPRPAPTTTTKAAAKALHAETAGAGAGAGAAATLSEETFAALGDRWSAGEKIAAVAAGTGMTWNRLYGELKKRGYPKAVVLTLTPDRDAAVA